MQQFSGIEWLKIDIANQYGLDKKTWQERLDWFDAQNGTFDLAEADEYYMASKALYAYQDAMNQVPTGHVVYLDATFSGAQIMACLTGCPTTARNVNLINTGRREDGYTNVTTAMNQYLPIKLPREVIKSPTMKTFYGSKADPIELFGEGTPELDAFYKALRETFPGACDYLSDVAECWQSDVYAHQWTLPDQCVAKVQVKKEIEGTRIEIDELGCSFTHNATINEPTPTGTSLQANIVQTIDAWIEREMIRRAHKQGFEILCVFDAFGCSPNHVNQMRQNFIDIMCELADMDLLGSILSEITGEKLVMKKEIENLSDYIRESEYMLS